MNTSIPYGHLSHGTLHWIVFCSIVRKSNPCIRYSEKKSHHRLSNRSLHHLLFVCSRCALSIGAFGTGVHNSSDASLPLMQPYSHVPQHSVERPAISSQGAPPFLAHELCRWVDLPHTCFVVSYSQIQCLSIRSSYITGITLGTVTSKLLTTRHGCIVLSLIAARYHSFLYLVKHIRNVGSYLIHRHALMNLSFLCELSTTWPGN